MALACGPGALCRARAFFGGCWAAGIMAMACQVPVPAPARIQLAAIGGHDGDGRGGAQRQLRSSSPVSTLHSGPSALAATLVLSQAVTPSSLGARARAESLSPSTRRRQRTSTHAPRPLCGRQYFYRCPCSNPALSPLNRLRRRVSLLQQILLPSPQPHGFPSLLAGRRKTAAMAQSHSVPREVCF